MNYYHKYYCKKQDDNKFHNVCKELKIYDKNLLKIFRQKKRENASGKEKKSCYTCLYINI